MSLNTSAQLSFRRWVSLLALVGLAASAGCSDDSGGTADAGTDLSPDGGGDTGPDTPDLAADVEADLEADLGVDVGPTPDEVPGTIEQLGRPEMDNVVAAHEAADPTDEQIVIYYYREDANYEPWAVWLWALGSGNGADHWDYTQDLTVVGGVGYLKFERDGSDIGGIAPVNEDNELGFIIREDAGWVKDGDEDRVWDADVSNEVVVFSGDQTSFPYGPYVPTIESATLLSETRIEVHLSGRHALTPRPSPNGFVVRRADGSGSYAITDVRNPNSGDRTNNYTDELLIILEEPAAIGPALVIEHPDYLQPARILAIDLMVALSESTLPADDYRLGAVYDADSGSVEFRLWTPLSESVTARLYSETAAASAAYEVPLILDEATGVWVGSFDEVDPEGMFYDYLVTNANGTNSCLDPYALSMDAYLDTGDAGRGAIIDLAAADATPEGWDQDEYYVLEQREDAIIYEIHVRDFTIGDDAGVTGEPGTYLAFIEKLPYLRELGVTHIQLLPVLNFYFTDESDRTYEDSGTASDNNYNWGYDPHNYFTPEGWFASDPADPYARVLELRELVQAIHDEGMAVLLDVVYNHYGNPFLLQNIAPDYYFRTNASGSLTSNSGVGNDTASTRAMMRRLILDSTRHWCEQYHVDGFRFDLMGLIDTVTMEAAYAGCAEVNTDVLFEGEGWQNMYNGPSGTRGTSQRYMTSTDNIAVFNDEIRDLMKGGGLDDERPGFLTRSVPSAAGNEAIYFNLTGRPQTYYAADNPADSMAYMAAHDNLTLHDNIAHNTGLDDEVAEERQAIIDRIKIGNFLILTGQSIPFVHGGQERARSKPKLNATTEVIGDYVSNSYDSADNINEYPWTVDAPADELVEFTSGLMWLRRNTPAFRIGDLTDIEAAVDPLAFDLGAALGYTVTWEGDTYFILANVDDEAITFDVGTDVSGATVLVDYDEADYEGVAEVTGIAINGSEVTLDPLTPALLLLED